MASFLIYWSIVSVTIQLDLKRTLQCPVSPSVRVHAHTSSTVHILEKGENMSWNTAPLAIKIGSLKWSLVTGSVALKCGIFCQEYIFLQDTWSLRAVVSQDRFSYTVTLCRPPPPTEMHHRPSFKIVELEWNMKHSAYKRTCSKPVLTQHRLKGNL